MLSAIELQDLRVFLTLAEELHYRRTAERLGVTTSNVSYTIRTLEARLGGRLFDRTSRLVALSPLGTELRTRIRGNYEALVQAVAQTQELAAEVVGSIRIGFTAKTDGPELNHLTQAFQRRYEHCRLELQEIENQDPYRLLRRGLIDVLVNWLAVDEPDLAVGPAIGHRERVLAVACDHRLAGAERVSLEDLAEEKVCKPPPSYPVSVARAISPTHTPTGRAIPRAAALRSSHEIVADVARGRMVHLTMVGVSMYQRADIALIPVVDMEPLPLGPIWVAKNENTKIRALAQTAGGLSPAAPEVAG